MQIGPADPTAVVTALKNAAAATGSDFHYLLGTAMRESSLKPQAQSSTSSASGLFQFVDQTWLGLVKTHGAQYGLASLADTIHQDSDGHYRAASDAGRRAILALKKDPQISALMAGEYTKTTQAAMQTHLGRPVCGGELYAGHFLGADAACKLIRANQSEPSAKAAALFPQAASANKSVFYNTDGSSRSVSDVYDWAMKQPGGGAVVTARADAAPAVNPVVKAASAVDSNIEGLLADVMNWQPRGFFESPSSDSQDVTGLPGLSGNTQLSGLNGSSPLALSPSLLSILSGSQKPVSEG